TRTTTRNSQGQVVGATDAEGHLTQYAYDPFGNLTRTIDVAGNVTTMTYDRRGRKTVMADPDFGTWHYVYDGLDGLTSQTDANGHTVTLSYDLLGRPIQRTEPDLVSCWEYDTATNGKGKLKTASTVAPGDTCATGARTYERTYRYDGLSRT